MHISWGQAWCVVLLVFERLAITRKNGIFLSILSSLCPNRKNTFMAVKVERVPGQPILIATLTGLVTGELVQEMFEQSAGLADQIGGHLYRITDVRNIDTTFGDLVRILKEASSHNQPGSSADPRFSGMLVGSSQWVKIFSQSLQQRQYGSLTIPLFDEMEAAMAYIQQQMNSRG